MLVAIRFTSLKPDRSTHTDWVVVDESLVDETISIIQFKRGYVSHEVSTKFEMK